MTLALISVILWAVTLVVTVVFELIAYRHRKHRKIVVNNAAIHLDGREVANALAKYIQHGGNVDGLRRHGL